MIIWVECLSLVNLGLSSKMRESRLVCSGSQVLGAHLPFRLREDLHITHLTN